MMSPRSRITNRGSEKVRKSGKLGEGVRMSDVEFNPIGSSSDRMDYITTCTKRHRVKHYERCAEIIRKAADVHCI